MDVELLLGFSVILILQAINIVLSIRGQIVDAGTGRLDKKCLERWEKVTRGDIRRSEREIREWEQVWRAHMRNAAKYEEKQKETDEQLRLLTELMDRYEAIVEDK